MKTLNFGIEIETIGQTRDKVAQAIAGVVGGTVTYAGGTYNAWTVCDRRGRTWKVVRDSSLNATQDFQAEIVSPILTYTDIEELQKVVRAVRFFGARVDASCGIHIHIDKSKFNAKTIRNLVKIINKQEAIIHKALGIADNRLARWCRGIDQDFLSKIEERKTLTMNDLNIAWYGRLNESPTHYDPSRYRGVNLHNIWYRGTVEFRWFEATLHAGKVKAYIQFCLALAAKALKARSANSKKRDFNAASGKYDFRVFLLSLGLIGDEFKTARLHLLSRLDGSAAWKNGRAAA